MALVIPSRAVGPLSDLVAQPPEKLESIATAIDGLTPSLSVGDLAQEVSQAAGIEPSQARELLDVLINVYILPESGPPKREELVSELIAAMESASPGAYSPASGDWTAARRFLDRFLGGDSPVGLISKSLIVSAGYEKAFCDASIFTDLRPVFRSVDDPPAAFLATHSLRITYHEGPRHERKDLFVVLDISDLDKLKKAIDRAQSKEAQLRSLVDKSGSLFLEVKS